MEPQHARKTSQNKPDPHASRSRAPEHALMEMLIGRWRTEGHNAPAAPDAPRTPVAGEQTYEWLPGRFFVLGRWSRQFGDSSHVGTSILGEDPERGLFAHNYDNLGYAREYVVTVRDRVWTLSGRYERARIEFSADGSWFRETWELSKDGTTWQPLCELLGRRA